MNIATIPRKPEWVQKITEEGTAVLRARILGHLAGEAQPELSDIRIVRGPADLDPMMPPFMTAYLTHAWSQ